MTSFKYNSIIPGLLLLLLAISGNFLADTYSCNLQKIFHTNILYKNFLVFLLMYFTIYFTEQKVENPLFSFIKTLIAYAFYLIFTKQMPSTLLISLTLLVIAFIFEQYKVYKNGNNETKQNETKDSTQSEEPPKDNKKEKYDNKMIDDKTITIIQIILYSISLFTTVIGYGMNYRNVKKTNDVSFVRYLFGFNKCDD